MDSESKLGLGLIALLALCCAGPLVVSLLASGAILGAISAIWVTDRPVLLLGAAVLIALGAALYLRQIVRRCGRRCCGPASPGC